MRPETSTASSARAQAERQTVAHLRGRVCAVIVAYFPSSQIVQNVEYLLPQVDHILIVDNGSSAPGAQAALKQCEAHPEVSVYYCGENLGVATALNIGARYAMTNGYEWVATFDQDSTAPSGYIEGLWAALDACPYAANVALISPKYQDRTCEPVYVKSYAARTTNLPFAPIDITMTSGNLVKVEAIVDVGFFDDSFFIDFLDYEFCLRLKSSGYDLIEAQNVLLMHRCGDRTTHRLLWRLVRTTNYPPWRRYYSMRNRVAVYRRYLLKRPAWVLADVVRPVRDIIVIALFEKNAGAKIGAMICGALDGLKGKMGKLPDSQPPPTD